MVVFVMNFNFSVLMSLYYAEQPHYLDCCLYSLSCQLVPPNEIVIVFDGPLPAELELIVDKWCKTLNIVIIRLPENVGLGKALNIGIQSCSYELVARMDTDDICRVNRFLEQIKMFKTDPDLSICGTNISEFEDDVSNVISQRKLPLSHVNIIKSSSILNPFNHMTVMYKKSHIQKVGGYKHMPSMEDWYLWLRLLAAGYKGVNLADVLVDARTGMAMMSRRSGLGYIKSEWMLTKVKVGLKMSSVPKALVIFLIRSIPRLLPKWLLLKVYILSRRFNE